MTLSSSVSQSGLARFLLDPELRELMAEEHRRTIRKSLRAFCTSALSPYGFAPAVHHDLLIGKLQAIADGTAVKRKLMVNMPPGSAKSTYGSHLFPAWFLGYAERQNILAASHTIGLAAQFSRRVQMYARDNADVLGYGLKSESAELWETTNGSSYKASGVGTGIAGFRADLGLIDDPVKNREDADSEPMRNKAWNWYTADFFPRLKPGAAQIVIMTRWHEDDLGGRLLATQGDEWDVVRLRAVARDDDPLGRAPGEMLWSDDAYGYGAKLRDDLKFYEQTGGMRDWSALYQQDPRPLEGSLFKTHLIPAIDAGPAGGNTVRAWDLASTAKTGTNNPDWTVGFKLTRYSNGSFLIHDVVRLRGGPLEVEAAIVNTAAQDGKSVRIGLPQDPGQAGKTQVLYFTSKLAGYVVESSPETGDKSTRAAPLAAQVNAGNVAMLRAGWNAPLIDEMSGFPSVTHDDQVDAASRAFSMLVQPPRKPILFSSADLARI